MKSIRSIFLATILLLAAGCISPELRTARIAVNDKEWDRALTALDAELARMPSAEVYYTIGVCYEKKNDLIEMSHNYTKSLEISDEFKDKIALSRGRLVRLYFARSTAAYDSATALEQMSDQDPALAAKQWQLALANLDTAIIIKPEEAVLYSQAAVTAYYAKEYDQAIASSIKAVEMEGDSADLGAREVLLSIYKERKDYENMIKCATDLMNVVDPQEEMNTYLGGFDVLMDAYKNLGQTAKAEEATQAAVNLFPDNVLLKVNLSVWLVRQEKFDLAFEVLEQILQIEPDNLIANLQLGTILTKDEKWEEAIPYLEKAHQVDQTNRDAVQNLMAAYYNSGRHEEGLEMKKKFEALLEGK